MQPLGHEASSDWRGDAPGCDIADWKIFGDGFGEELHHGPGNAADLHPAFQDGAFLLPEVIGTPPSLEVMENGFDLPAVTIEDDHLAGGQMGLGGEIEAGRRPALMLFVVEGAPDGADRMAVQKSRLGDEALEADFCHFP